MTGHFGNLVMDIAAPPWEDVSEAADPCWTIARPDGVGALQVSTLHYEAGKVPDPSPAVLLELARAQAPQPPLQESMGQSAGVRWAWISYMRDGFGVRQWIVSDGIDLGNITYTCAVADWPGELAEVEAMVQGARFEVEAQRAA